jgi:hypothetical protein
MGHIAELKQDGYSWRVEKILDDGAVEVTIFSGPEAKRRADQYATWRYGEFIER